MTPNLNNLSKEIEEKKMKERPDLNILSKQVYEANKSKGWHDKEYSNEHYLCLVISELMEAVEADRKGKRAQMSRYNDAIKNAEYVQADGQEWQSAFFRNLFKLDIKDSVEDELADAVIRLLDLAGVREVKLTEDKLIECVVVSKSNSFVENIYFLQSEFPRSTVFDEFLNPFITWDVLNIEALCTNLSIDLWLHVELKLKYNSTRPYKHGKEY